VWTPKRIVLLAVGVVLFVSGYLVYGRFLGSIDGLPPLPDEYHPSGLELSPLPHSARPSVVEARLRQAFGEDCDELNRPIKLELQPKRMLLAAQGFKLVKSSTEEEEGGKEFRCLRLNKVSLALFSENRNDGRGVEINTIQADVGYLTFDRPISTPYEASSRKIVAGELRGDIRIINNRRTPGRDDDLVLLIPGSPLYYDEARHLVWTDGIIQLKDYQSKPKPIQIDGTGMEMELLTEPPAKPGAPAPRKAKGDSVTGVKRIVLRAGVTMHLYAAGQFLGGANKEAGPARPAAEPAEAPEKAHVTIVCPGRFQYDFLPEGDLAQFDVPARDPKAPAPPANGVGNKDVKVTRLQEKLGLVDQLFCQHLELRLRRKEPPPGGRGASADRGLDIESAHAVGELVTLTSDAEKLDAHGNDFSYDARTATTVLKGTPEMWARRDGSEIRARELHLQEQKVEGPGKTVKTYQKATAFGPGRVELAGDLGPDAKKEPAGPPKAERKPVVATWNDTLVSTKDGPYDLLTLTGAARFFDEENDQWLQADTLKVWLKSSTKEVSRAQDASPGPGNRPEPREVEARGNVLCRSRELNINRNNHLQIWFEDVPVEGTLPTPAAVAPGGAGPSGEKAPEPAGGVPPIPAPPDTLPQAGKPKAPTQAKPDEPPRPINLEAHTVQAWAQRSGQRTTLQRLWTEGRVHVQQAPAKPDEGGVDIHGETLELLYHPDGNVLTVRGGDDSSGEDIARLEMDRTKILGREVIIDQAANKASVTGAGAMTLVSATDFEGGKLEKPVPMTIYWTKSMLFLGKSAEFYGNIQAEQDNAHMQCEQLQVTFDKPISLKEGTKTDQNARVQTMVCNRAVRVEDSKFEGKKLVAYHWIMGQEMEMNSLDEGDRKPGQPSEGNEMRTKGPGAVRIYQQSADTAGGPAPGAKKPAPAKPTGSGKSAQGEMKLTYVEFRSQVIANSKHNRASFYDGIRLLVLPTENPRQEINLDLLDLNNLPPGALFMTCGQLTVVSSPAPGGKKYQWMEAKKPKQGSVNVLAREFMARCDSLVYSEEDDKIIFTGSEGVPAALYKRAPNGDWEKNGLFGRKIIYRRSDGTAVVEGGESIISR
jgi:lipopolysaccharide export system protein LptA